MNVALATGLLDNPHIDQWIGFAEPGTITIGTGEVETGQGMLTAVRQIAEELDVALDRIAMYRGSPVTRLGRAGR